MPHTKSAAKRMRTSEEARLSNKSVRSMIVKAKKAVVAATASGDVKKKAAALCEFFSVVDKAAKKGVIKSNTANRRKSRAAILARKGPGHQASTTAATIA